MDRRSLKLGWFVATLKRVHSDYQRWFSFSLRFWHAEYTLHCCYSNGEGLKKSIDGVYKFNHKLTLHNDCP